MEVGGGVAEVVAGGEGEEEGVELLDEGWEVFGADAGEDVVEEAEAEAGGGEEFEALVPGVAGELLLFFFGHSVMDLEGEGVIGQFVVEPGVAEGFEFGFGGGEDVGDDVVGAVVGGAEAEEGAELAQREGETSPAAPGADEPVEAEGVLSLDSEGDIGRIVGVAAGTIE